MPHEPAIDARVIGATVKLEVCHKVQRKFRRAAEDSLSTIYARALEDSVRDVELTADDYKSIAREIERNLAKRNARRKGVGK